MPCASVAMLSAVPILLFHVLYVFLCTLSIGLLFSFSVDIQPHAGNISLNVI